MKKNMPRQTTLNVNFKRNLLLIDTEFSGFDLNKHELLQIAGILLDKKTLKEKKVFNTFIKPANWDKRNYESMAVNKISWEMVKSAPSLSNTIKSFDKAFGHNVIMAAYVGFNDKRFLQEAYKKAKVKWQFDYHYFDLWAFFYAVLAAKGKLTGKKDFAGFGLESLIKMFKIKVGNGKLHDALVDCRVEAEILRQVIKQIK